MFNHKGSHSITELSIYLEKYTAFFIQASAANDKKFFNFLKSPDFFKQLFTIKNYYELAIEANNLFHFISEKIEKPVKEYDFSVFSNDLAFPSNTSKIDYNITLVLDNIRSPFNAGGFFRLADAAGIKKIIIGGFTPGPENPKLLRSAMNTIDSTHFEKHRLTEKYISNTKNSENPPCIISVETCSQSVNYTDLNYTSFKEMIIVFGNEEFGVNENILNSSDYIIRIPMFGKKNSMNVLVSAGIIIYNIIAVYGFK